MRAFQLAQAAGEDEEALAPAAELSGLDAEIAVLRVLIRRAVGGRSLDAVRRGIESLRRALETKGRLEAAEAGAWGAESGEGGRRGEGEARRAAR